MPSNTARDASQGVREDTAELASWALSDIASNHSEHSPSRHNASSTAQSHQNFRGSQSDQDELSRHESTASTRPEPIPEVSEPSSSHGSDSSQPSQCQSALTALIRSFPQTEESSSGIDEDESPTTAGIRPVTVREGIISQPSERTSLLGKRTAYSTIKDLEGQPVAVRRPISRIREILQRSKDQTASIIRVASNPKSWNRQNILEYGIRQPANFVPPVLLGLLLNILDALSYGESQVSEYLSE